MTERRSSRKTGFAGMDVATIFRREPRQVENFDFDLPRAHKYIVRDLNQSEALRHLAWTCVLGSRGTVDKQKAGRAPGIAVALLRRFHGFVGRSQSTAKS